MSVVDDLKNSLGRSDDSSKSSRSRSNSNSSNFDDTNSSFDSQSTNNQKGGLDDNSSRPGRAGHRGDNQSSPDPGSGRNPQQNKSLDGSPQQDLGSNTGRGQDNLPGNPGSQSSNQGQGRGQARGGGRNQNDHPNAQAGRPQQGSSQPQLSSQTQRKMENAGLDSNDSRGRNQESVADRQDGFEELKSQNEQIIELLKRINRNLEQLGR